VDLRRRFSLPVIEYGPTTVVIVLKVQGADRMRIIGIVVDAVSDVCSVAEAELRPPPDFGGAVSVDFVRGLATVEEKMIILLDIDQLLNSVTAASAG
jgi:purine-binding chemotaxis protein CheW